MNTSICGPPGEKIPNLKNNSVRRRASVQGDALIQAVRKRSRGQRQLGLPPVVVRVAHQRGQWWGSGAPVSARGKRRRWWK